MPVFRKNNDNIWVFVKINNKDMIIEIGDKK